MIENEVWLISQMLVILINQILLFLNILIFSIFFVDKFKSKKPQILIFLLLGMASTIQLAAAPELEAVDELLLGMASTIQLAEISNFQYSSIIILLCNVIWTRIMYKDIDFINFWQSAGKE